PGVPRRRRRRTARCPLSACFTIAATPVLLATALTRAWRARSTAQPLDAPEAHSEAVPLAA
ncbi:hypothetical protein, partial [Catenulispora rubra]|uniref:hypothetical protein n=1 Tax=Catenulispora rubra TaxID=280293 RepID=UPI001E38862C